MSLHNSTLIMKTEDCLKQIKRQQVYVLLCKAVFSGLLLSTIGLLLYIAIWPNASAKIAALHQVFEQGFFAWPFSVVVPLLGIWLALSLLLCGLVFGWFYYRQTQHTGKLSPLALSPTQFFLHLNREHKGLEESAHFFALPETDLSVMQTMQIKRITPLLEKIITSADKTWLPRVSFRSMVINNLFVFIAGAVLLAGTVLLVTYNENMLQSGVPNGSPTTNSKAEVSTNFLDAISITVTPPPYTKLPSYTQDSLNMSVVQGTEIEWFIPMPNNSAKQYAFELTVSRGEVLSFVPNKQGHSIKFIAQQALVYSIEQLASNENFISDIATIMVKADTKPLIKFKEPLLTITEFPKNISPTMTTLVSITDDYEITNAKIVASIAKGMGEAVKFRDQTFRFDVENDGENADLFRKTFDLLVLGMEPGDELYFSVHASDNKTPQAQITISPIKIVRWLEDEEAKLSSDGIVIDFMPEYFKSQQQIIIETQALIEDAPNISEDKFNAISRGLGNDQSDLKQSYGQYLGDEFESGVMETMEAGPSITNIEEQHDDEEHGDETDGNGELEHKHETTASHVDDISGYQQAIEQFGHNHGEADIGFIKITDGQINPKVLMKRAIAAMWQAELHLQLSEPELALPFEKQALNYLNRAKQAERIYVKRLGFEPPPVTEERRYTGKMKDILSYTRDIDIELTINQNRQFIEFIALLNNQLTLRVNNTNEVRPLSPKARTLVNEIAQVINNKVKDEPEWVSQLANLQRIQIADSFDLTDCDNCIRSLLWSLAKEVSSPIAHMYTRESALSADHKGMKAYYDGLLNTVTPNKPSQTKQEGNKP